MRTEHICSFVLDVSLLNGNVFFQRKKPDADSSCPSSEVIWRPNFEELIRRLRHKVLKTRVCWHFFIFIFFAYSHQYYESSVFFKACVEIVKERRDERCANVLKAMLEVGRSQEKKAKTDKSGKV